jgi:hypothetical protein
MGIQIFQTRCGDEHLSSHSGLALIGALLSKTSINERVDSIPVVYNPPISNGDTLRSMIGLCCLGKPNFEAIEPMREQPFFAQALGLNQCPSCSTLRQRFDMVDGRFDTILKEESAKLIKLAAPTLTPVISEVHGSLLPLDSDVSPFDNSNTHKEGVSWTYKNHDGFAPIFSYLGREGYLVNAELREGKQHCQKDTPAFLEDSITYAQNITGKPLLLRLDSGNDSKENIRLFENKGVFYLIKRNLRKESLAEWLELAKKEGTLVKTRKGKRRWYGEKYVTIEGIEDPVRIVYDIVERTITAKGQILLFPEIEVDTYWTNLKDSVGHIIELYHDHGTSEQYHSELKSDMDLERLPSGHFKTNSLVLLLGMVAYNLLRLCGQESLQEIPGEAKPAYRKKAKRRRVRTVMQDLIYLACKIVKGSGRVLLSFGKFSAWAGVWQRIYKKFTSLPAPCRAG